MYAIWNPPSIFFILWIWYSECARIRYIHGWPEWRSVFELIPRYWNPQRNQSEWKLYPNRIPKKKYNVSTSIMFFCWERFGFWYFSGSNLSMNMLYTLSYSKRAFNRSTFWVIFSKTSCYNKKMSFELLSKWCAVWCDRILISLHLIATSFLLSKNYKITWETSTSFW